MSPDLADPKRVALVISDVDGTLLDDNKQLSPGATRAVQRLYAAGIRFTIASARPPQLARALVRELSVREPFACFNGALTVAADETILHELPIQTADAQIVADWILRSGFDLWVWTDKEWYVSNPTGPHVAHHEELMGSKATVLPTHDMSRFCVLKLVGVSEDHPALARAEQEAPSLRCRSISATRSSEYYLDVTDAGANKGAVVLTLSLMLGIPAAAIATIGDMTTDTLMFCQSGVSIAMGNAHDDVKARATAVTKSNNDDGFAYAMDTIILGNVPQRIAAD
jgi:Cof subfamily protein (haloacid dehalogenase superfamily)